jgi:allophanate hydrolase subunit 1
MLNMFAPSTAQKNINLSILNKLLVPLPPLREMLKIIEKVDALMALCDELEKTVEQSKQESEILMQSVLQEAFSKPKKANHIVNFPVSDSDDSGQWGDMVARAEGISSETLVEITNTQRSVNESHSMCSKGCTVLRYHECTFPTFWSNI